MQRETLVLMNPASAAGSTGRRWVGLERRIEAALGPIRVERTSGPGDASRLARAACEHGVARIVVAGGDGTVGEVASGLLAAGSTPENRPALGLLPLGSGCDLARSLGLPRRLRPALAVIAAGRLRTIDAGRVEYRDATGAIREGRFVNEASAGLSGATVQIVGRLSKRIGPRVGFAAGAVGAILSHRAVDMAVEIDGARIHEGLVSLIVAANGRYFGAGMKVAPEAEADDGQLEVVVVRGLSMPRLLANLPSLLAGRHLGHPAVSRHAARELVVIPKQASSPIEVDGEALGFLPFRAAILPAALRIFAPGPATERLAGGGEEGVGLGSHPSDPTEPTSEPLTAPSSATKGEA